ncbi:Type I Iterative PKS [Diplodia seriata]
MLGVFSPDRYVGPPVNATSTVLPTKVPKITPSSMTTTPEPIAIIGSACRFPGGSSSPSELWKLLREPRDILQEFPDDRLKLSNFYNQKKGHHGSTDVQNKSYLLAEDCRLFDAAFFNVNPLEAASMDPAQRILLETVYETIEAAGYTMEQLQGTPTAVFVGLMTGDYWDMTMRDTETMPTYTASGMSRSIMSNRISYVFDLRGPSMTIDTACSSSLVALHQAVQSLRSGEATTAIVAGANMLLDASTYIMESKLQMLSPDSRCRMWDESANGYARGEGVAAILLKPLSAALADGDDIECIIRGTGVNSDGRTKGIAMPSAEAQAALIRETYMRAGLDPVADRCQYFECHGTGTQAGDPVEAQAIADTFFPDSRERGEGKLYVGSIKTVIGHLEGCAGLAGVLKASLAVQNRTVPANMHFTKLNPKVEPFYQNLEILRTSIGWPEVSSGPRRVSVNSFGFGGTNAHAIVESYDGGKQEATRDPTSDFFRGPLAFSARTESSLRASIREFANFIKSNPSADLEDVTSILQEKRKAFPVRHYFPGSTREKLIENLDGFVTEPGSRSNMVTRTESRNTDEPARVLGIFTGQGAQWAGMGSALIEHCQQFRETINRCEASLAALPDPPPWSLKAELLANDTSQISQAAFSQPLCTALQLAMVDVAAAAGVGFSAVVGHSSGEIAAAYAAGILSVSDAMAIAYYRGVHAKLAEGEGGKKGGMMAVGMTYEKALEVCSQPEWAGRIGLAASNSPSSVTLSGDADAIKEARAVFDEHKTFARELKVDTAYHSHHMLPCAGSYLDSLLACNIQPRRPKDGCTWVSSVLGDASLLDGGLEALSGPYWVDNMVKPVLFSQALESSFSTGRRFDMAVEVGPHPALKGPATQVFKTALGSSPPHTGFMRRGEDEVEAFSAGIGFLWANLSPSPVDFAGYRRAFQGSSLARPKIPKGLPSYAWDHDKTHWKEGRISRNFRLRPQTPHELLGRRMADDSEHDRRWRNFLRLSELSWLRGHEFQGQALFPAAGHVAMALEASRKLAGDRAVRLFELRNISIYKPIVLDGDQPGVETVFGLRLVNEELRGDGGRKDVLEADFTTSACFDEAAGQLEKIACGTVVVHLGESTGEELPPPEPARQCLAPVDIERVYSSLAKIGLNYHGQFRSIVRAERMRDHCKASATWKDHEMAAEYMVHPALLDVSFQAMFVALTSPATTGALWTTYLPSSIERITVDPSVCHDYSSPTVTADIEAFVTEWSSSSFAGDVTVLDASGMRSSIQVEGLRMKAIAEATPANDRLLFAKTAWDVDIAHSVCIPASTQDTAAELALLSAIERTAAFYLRSLLAAVPASEIRTFSPPHRHLFAAASTALSRIANNHNPTVAPSTIHDTPATIAALHAAYPTQADMRLMHAVHTALLPSLRGQTSLLEAMLASSHLTHFYRHSWGTSHLNAAIARILAQITSAHPASRILELGAGTGGTTGAILAATSAFASYTYTDVSAGFFGDAAARFRDPRMAFRVLDIEREPGTQGFAEGGYDVVVAANVLHATACLAGTLANARKLLRPGGWLVLLEITAPTLKHLLVFGGLPGWWLGAGEGRTEGPWASDVQWDGLMRRAGFGGVEACVRDLEGEVGKHGCSVLVARAVDGVVEALREPMGAVEEGGVVAPERVVVLGGRTLPVLKLVRAVQERLGAWKARTVVVEGVDALDVDALPPGSAVICLAELDRPLFEEAVTDDRLEKLQRLFGNAEAVLWAIGGEPECKMTVGIGRALRAEMPHLTLQFLEARRRSDLTATVVVECFLRLILAADPAVADHDMLWTVEPEVLVDGGELLLPRLVPDTVINDRFNAERRQVEKTVSTRDTCVEMATLDSGSFQCLRETAQPEGAVIDVHYSTTLSKDCTITLGLVRGTLKPAVALSRTAASAISRSEKHVMLPDGHSCTHGLISDVASHALSLELVKLCPPGGSVLVHEAPTQLAAALRYAAAAQGISVMFSNSNNAGSVEGSLHLHNMATERTIRSLIPRMVGCFIDLSSSPSTTIPRCLPQRCVVYTFTNSTDIISSVATVPLEEALTNAIAHPLNAAAIGTLINIQELTGASDISASYPSIVHWNEPSLRVAVRPLNPAGLFKPDKTYLLVGLTGEIGRTLTTFMISNGARHIALASRSATTNIDSAWLSSTASYGATVNVFNMDVTDRSSVHTVHAAICATMPPIAGVCNGAMVLHDTLFAAMDARSLNAVLAPKVAGTRHLSDLFAAPTLDFFVLFSSLASVVGNPGQANYHAANLFVAGLAAARRARGLAASVMHVGMVADVGYVARAGREVEERLRGEAFLGLSEGDLCALFAEAVGGARLAADGGEEGGWDVVAGLDVFVEKPGVRRPHWAGNPRLAHFVRGEEDGGGGGGAAAAAAVVRDVGQRLDEVGGEGEDAAAAVVQEALLGTVEVMLQMAPGTADAGASLLALGMDSLVAVEIRAWFLKKVGVDVSVLRLLGGETVAAICRDVAGRYMAAKASGQ